MVRQKSLVNRLVKPDTNYVSLMRVIIIASKPNC